MCVISYLLKYDDFNTDCKFNGLIRFLFLLSSLFFKSIGFVIQIFNCDFFASFSFNYLFFSKSVWFVIQILNLISLLLLLKVFFLVSFVFTLFPSFHFNGNILYIKIIDVNVKFRKVNPQHSKKLTCKTTNNWNKTKTNIKDFVWLWNFN